ncbi:uncharacterized protein LOC116205726 [Punica granatum]|uniref:Uncharacterized protein n=2 Tax=Punica granatum TaxID=22663 RepID=A0A218X4N0_PUNGR|nr:uncharacterized protein LOC116205726 [Punica granatum]OWM79679.1 hypothetical protein CDL15_Pgr023091 [Punica granatum]PKI53913.1 hypothetical protein CRG98_025707 [Punica granatum]
MMMSMFSSFEALSAETSFGQKLSFSAGPSWRLPSKAKDEPAVSADEKRSKEADSDSAAPQRKDVGGRPKSEEQQRRRPRFAPELDGVHCFETLVLY